MNLKYINKQLRITFNLFLIFLMFCVQCLAQPEVMVEGIEAVVGNKIILKSDVEASYQQYISQGNYGSALAKCQVLDQMLLNKLLLNQAAIDSVDVTEAQIQGELDSRIAYFVQQLGSEQKLEEYYKKSVLEIKEEFRPLIKDQLQIRAMQAKVSKNSTTSPAEIKAFFESIPADSLPYINAEIEYAQIIKKIPLDEAEKKAAVATLEEYRQRILKGEEFSTLAVLYSQDGSAKNGGELGFTNRGDLVPEFEAAAFKLKPGEISPVVETKFGFHIIQMIERRGDQINVRHILLRPKVSEADISRVGTLMDSIANLINMDSLSFTNAAYQFSDDAETKYNGGNMLNPQTGNTHFEPDQVDPTVFFILDKLTVGGVSSPALIQTPEGDQVYRMLILKTRTSPHKANLVDDYQKLQEQTIAEKQNKIMQDWVQKKVKSTYVKVSDTYKDCDILKIWFKQTTN